MKRNSNTIDLRIENTKAIYNFLRINGDSTKSQIANGVGLTFASASNICGVLESMGVIGKTTTSFSTGGRKAIYYRFVKDYSCSFIIDLHNTEHCHLGFVNLLNNIIIKDTFQFEENDNLESIMEKIKIYYNKLIKQISIPVLGICVGISAVYKKDTGTSISSSNPVFEGINIYDTFKEAFPNKLVVIENDANLAALSQLNYYQERHNSLFIFITEGVGMGIIINGELFYGNDGFAGELGHFKVSEVTKKCKCGRIGCLRLVATLKSIATDLDELDLFNSFSESIEYAKILADRYEEGEEKVCQRIDFLAKKLGEVVASLTDIFNPDQIQIGGNFDRLFPLINPIIRQEFRKISKLAKTSTTRIVCINSSVGELMLKGGGERFFHAWLNSGAMDFSE
ncbi:MAG: ROK family protein [Pleomorphochaeta sp.]